MAFTLVALIWGAQVFAQSVSNSFFGSDVFLIPWASWLLWTIFTVFGIIWRYDMDAAPEVKGGPPRIISRQQLRSMIIWGVAAGFIAFGLCEMYRFSWVPPEDPPRYLPGMVQCAIIAVCAAWSRKTVLKFVGWLDNKTNTGVNRNGPN